MGEGGLAGHRHHEEAGDGRDDDHAQDHAAQRVAVFAARLAALRPVPALRLRSLDLRFAHVQLLRVGQ
jgi:hypothetical protein